MRDILDVLNEKQHQVNMLKHEIIVLRASAMLLREEGDPPLPDAPGSIVEQVKAALTIHATASETAKEGEPCPIN